MAVSRLHGSLHSQMSQASQPRQPVRTVTNAAPQSRISAAPQPQAQAVATPRLSVSQSIPQPQAQSAGVSDPLQTLSENDQRRAGQAMQFTPFGGTTLPSWTNNLFGDPGIMSRQIGPSAGLDWGAWQDTGAYGDIDESWTRYTDAHGLYPGSAPMRTGKAGNAIFQQQYEGWNAPGSPAQMHSFNRSTPNDILNDRHVLQTLIRLNDPSKFNSWMREPSAMEQYGFTPSAEYGAARQNRDSIWAQRAADSAARQQGYQQQLSNVMAREQAYNQFIQSPAYSQYQQQVVAPSPYAGWYGSQAPYSPTPGSG